MLGLYVTTHPLASAAETVRDLVPALHSSLAHADPDELIPLIAHVAGIKEIRTKKGDAMAFATLEDESGSVETVVFPRTLVECPDVFIADQCIVIKAKVSHRNGEISLIAEKAKKL